MNSIKQKISQSLSAHIRAEASALENMLEVPPDAQMGDYALPCFAFAKELRKSPVHIALQLSRELVPPAAVREVKAAGPYLNFFLDHAALFREILTGVREEDFARRRTKRAAAGTVVIDYSSPNIAKKSENVV